MSHLLAQYYRGITRQLRSEIDFINSLFEHQGLKGEGNEAALRQLLTKFIPKRYSIGTGVVVDRHGNSSRQCDIVIYDTFLYPSLLSLTSVHIFPVDVVYATIEIKTTLTSQTAKESLANIASVRGLDFVKEDFADAWSQGQNYHVGTRMTSPPIGFIFAYNCDATTDETFKKWFTPNDDNATPMYPSIVSCLDMGVLCFAPAHAEEATSVQTEKGMKPQCKTFPLVKAKGNKSVADITSSGDVEFAKLSAAPPDRMWNYEGSDYPVKTVGTDIVAIDQSRILLVTLLQVTELLARKKLNPYFSFVSTYLNSLDLFHFVV